MRTVLLCTALLVLAACHPVHKPLPADPGQPAHGENGNAETVPAGKEAQEKALRNLEPNFLFLAAQTAIDQGQLAAAALYLGEVVRRDPYATLPRAQLAESLLKSGQAAASLPHFSALLDSKQPTTGASLRQDERIRLRLLQAAANIQAQHPEIARAILRNLLRKHPKHEGVRIELAKLYLGDNRLEEALSVIHQGIAAHDSARLRQIEVQILLRQRRFSQALNAMRSMLALAPDNAKVAVLFARFARQMKRTDAAEETLRTFLKRHPGNMVATRALGGLLLQAGRSGEAILLYQEFLKRAPVSQEARNTLGLLYLQNRQYGDAETLLAGQTDDEARFYYAASIEAQKRDAAALNIYQRLLDSSLKRKARLRIAAIEARAGHEEKALGILRALLKDKEFQHPQRGEAWSLLSSILLHQDRYQQTIDETAEALRQPPVASRLLFNRAVAFEHEKRYDEAEQMLRQQLAQDPNNSEALNFLGYMLAEQGIRLDEAEQLIRRALNSKPDDAYYLDSLAWVYYQRGDYARAIKLQNKAITRVSDDAVMFEHLGDMEWKQGMREPARAHWRKALKLNHPEPDLIRSRIRDGL